LAPLLTFLVDSDVLWLDERAYSRNLDKTKSTSVRLSNIKSLHIHATLG
jgi:hypothetical protein